MAQFLEQAPLECEQSGEIQLGITSRLELLLEFERVPRSQRCEAQDGIGRETYDGRRQNGGWPDNKAPENFDQAIATLREHLFVPQAGRNRFCRSCYCSPAG